MLEGLIDIINHENEIHHIPVTREEEGVGIAAGAFLGGKNPMLLMQNSGLGNSINALKSLIELYETPLVLMMSHRGAEGEKISAQIPMGQVTIPLLKCIGIDYLVVDSQEEVKRIPEFIHENEKLSKSSAIILKRNLWEGRK
jgi:sulfopyruvate decarboxylase subunit alpha